MWDDIIAGIPKDTPDTASAVTTVDGRAVQSPVRNVDADTLAIDKKRYRLEGLNAPETSKFQGGVFIPGQQAGDTTQETLNKVAQAGGYNNLKTTGRKDPYGRYIARQENDAGQSLGDTAVALGITDPNAFSSNEAVGQRTYINALAGLMPSLAGADPMIREAREAYEARVKQSGEKPLFVPKLTLADEATYAAAKTIVGTAAVKEQLEEMARLEEILAKPDLSPDTRAKLQKQHEEAREKAFFAGITPDMAGSVLHRQHDRTIMNQAYNQMSTSLTKNVIDIKKGFYGYMEQVGDGQKWDWLAQKGREGVTRAKVEAGNMADTLSSIRDIRTGGDTWDTIGDTASYVGNLMAGTLPYVAMAVGSMVGAGAVAGGATAAALSALPSAIVYSGQFYADQPDEKKNSALAFGAGIGSAVLDRIGLEGILKGGNIFSHVGREEVIGALVQSGKAASREAAEEQIKGATKATLIEMSNAGVAFAEKHYKTKEAALAALRNLGVAAGGESVTESGQTLLELFAVSGEIDPDLRFEKHFYTSLVDAAIGGGVMGGTINVGGTALDIAQWGSAANALRAYEGQLNDNQAFLARQKELKEAGVPAGSPQGVTSVLEAITKIAALPEDGTVLSLDNLPGRPGNWNGFMSIVRDPVRLLRSWGSTTVKNMRKANGEMKFFLPVLKSIMQPGILAGDAYDGFRQRIIGEWHTPDAETLATELKVGVHKASAMLKEAWQTTWSRGERLGDSPQELTLQAWKDRVDSVSEQASILLTEMGYDTSAMGDLDTVFIDAAVDPQIIAKNEARIVNKMVENGANPRHAAEAIANMISGNKELVRSGRDTMNQYGVFRDKELNDLFEPNIFAAFENFKHRIATDATQALYLGKDGQLLAKLIHFADQNGEFETEQERLDVQQNVKDFYKVATGTYNSLENYPFIEKVLNWGVTLTMLASLGKAALSSLPEIALSTLGTSGDKIHKQLGESFKTLGDELRSEINKAISFNTAKIGISYARNAPYGRAQIELNKILEEEERLDGIHPDDQDAQYAKDVEALSKRVKQYHKKYMGRSLFEKLGFNDTGYNTQAKFETNSANAKRAMQLMASVIGLNALTNATRIGTLSMAGDILSNRLLALRAIPVAQRAHSFQTGAGMSNAQFQALKEMQSWGLDVEFALSFFDAMDNATPDAYSEIISGMAIDEHKRLPPEQRSQTENDLQYFRDNMMSSMRNMLDQRIANPQITNMPKYYHDPRFRIFTAMTRFMAVFTANQLPRLYRDFIKEGSVSMQYQAFTTIVMALAFAHMANMLKDILSYSDDENPYIKSNVKKAQRALYGSGLLGRMEGVVDTVSPLYPQKKVDPTEAPITYAYESFKNQAAPVSWADRAVRSMYQLSTGNEEQGTKNLVRSLPLVGSFPAAAEYAAKQVKE